MAYNGYLCKDESVCGYDASSTDMIEYYHRVLVVAAADPPTPLPTSSPSSSPPTSLPTFTPTATHMPTWAPSTADTVSLDIQITLSAEATFSNASALTSARVERVLRAELPPGWSQVTTMSVSKAGEFAQVSPHIGNGRRSLLSSNRGVLLPARMSTLTSSPAPTTSNPTHSPYPTSGFEIFNLYNITREWDVNSVPIFRKTGGIDENYDAYAVSKLPTVRISAIASGFDGGHIRLGLLDSNAGDPDPFKMIAFYGLFPNGRSCECFCMSADSNFY